MYNIINLKLYFTIIVIKTFVLFLLKRTLLNLMFLFFIKKGIHIKMFLNKY